MGTMARRVLVITLVGTSFVVTACGSDHDSAESSKTAAGTTGGAGPTSQIPAIPEIPGNTPGQRSGGGGSSTGNGSSGSNGSSGKDRSRRTNDGEPGLSAPGNTPTPPGGAPPDESPTAPAQSDTSTYRISKEICANVTLEGIAVNLRINLKERDAAFVAKAFSRRYPKQRRDAAYKGCLEGFRQPVQRP
jgi:hypothetical protein